MSHDLDMTTGRAAIAYRQGGGLPWHTFGRPMPDNCTVEEAFELADCTWQAEKVKAYIRNPLWKPGMPLSEKAIEVPNFVALVRNDTYAIIGKATPQYGIIQLADLAKVWQETLTDASGKMQGMVETVLSLNGGSRVVCVFKLPGDWTIAGEEHVPYLTATTSFDCSSHAIWGLTITRTVCANTLAMSLGEWQNQLHAEHADSDAVKKGAALKVRHRGNVAAKLEKVSGIFQKAFAEFNGYKEKAEKLADTRLSLKDARELLAKIVEGESDRAERMRDDILALAYNGKGQRDNADIQGSAYALLQGCTEYVDHHRMLEASPEKRFSYITDGAGSRLKQRMQATLVREFASVKAKQEADHANLLDSILQ